MSQIVVIGCGHRREQLTLEAADALRRADAVVLHTRRCGLTAWLESEGIAFSTLDALCRALDCQPGDILAWEPDKEEYDGF